MFKYYQPDYINRVKAELGYDSDSLNINVRNNAASFGRIMLLGHLAALTSKFYNLSLEKDGLLFIQRGTYSNKLLKDKSFFISHDAIQEVILKKGTISYKMTIVDTENKKTHFLINKVLLGAPWQKESLAKLIEIYG